MYGPLRRFSDRLLGIKPKLASVLARLLLAALGNEEVEQRIWDIVNAPWTFRRKAGNLAAELARNATRQSAEYIEQKMAGVPGFALRLDLLKFALYKADAGLYLEFGVAKGGSINFIADHFGGPVHGFDSFEGLPEFWIDDAPQGAMSTGGRLPEVRKNVELHVGWFENTLPSFVAAHRDKVAFLHIDCDLYSSTKTVFKYLADRIQSGTIIEFDEYFNYPGWQNHEFKAFQEFVAERNLRYEYLGYVTSGFQVAVAIL